VEKKVAVHDLHATILALLGFDHEKLTSVTLVAIFVSLMSPGKW